jgi:hypothetical protein
MKRTLYSRLRAGVSMMAVVGICAACKPADKAGGGANADLAASGSPSAASQ